VPSPDLKNALGLGYYAEQPYMGQGYMTEGMRLALRHIFMAMRLHRVEANVQPENAASIALVKRSRFRLEGFSPRSLKVAVIAGAITSGGR
jgi:[ribosomal protein S5]-alanine N-acetyltransferase